MSIDLKSRFSLLKEKFYDVLNAIVPWIAIIIVFLIVTLPFFFFARYAWKRNNALYEHLMKIETQANDNSISVPSDAEIYVIQPQGEQDVVIVGDPDKITVKPKNKK